MKKIECFCVALLLLCTTVVCASDFKVNGICYNIISEAGATVEVASGSCSGTIVILQSVNYNGKNYSVTAVGDRAFSNSMLLQASNFLPV